MTWKPTSSAIESSTKSTRTYKAMEQIKEEKSTPRDKTLNLFERLLAISMEIGYVNKNLVVGIKQSSYKAVGEADVLAAVKPLEKKYGVYSYPVNREVIESKVSESQGDGYTKYTYFERIKVTYRFVNIDDTKEFIDIVSYGDGIDPGDKSVGKAMTYADKYALLKAYKIMTGEDPDQDPSDPGSDNGYQSQVQGKPQSPQKPQGKPQGTQSQAKPSQSPSDQTNAPSDEPMASQKQNEFVQRILSEKAVTADMAMREVGIDYTKPLTKKQASALIDWLLKQKSKSADEPKQDDKKEEPSAVTPIPDDDLPF
jgi:ubiquitin